MVQRESWQLAGDIGDVLQKAGDVWEINEKHGVANSPLKIKTILNILPF